MRILGTKNKKETYSYKIKCKNGEILEGCMTAFNIEQACDMLMQGKINIVENNTKAFYFNRDDFLTVEINLIK
jgi:hypothetical protein